MDDGPQLACVNTESLHTTKNKPLEVDESSEFSGYPIMNCKEAWEIELACRKVMDNGPQLAHVDTGCVHAPKIRNEVGINANVFMMIWWLVGQEQRILLELQNMSVPTRPSFVQQCVPSSSLLGVKRNRSEDLPPPPHKIQHLQQPPQHIEDQQLLVQQLQGQQLLQHTGLQGQQPIHQQPQQRMFPAQQFSEQIQISMHPPALNPMTPLWCELCQVVCTGLDNLRQHQQGKKHKFKASGCFDGEESNMSIHSGVIWCPECQIPCMNGFSLAQHRRGKKHLLCMLELNGCKDEPQDQNGGETSSCK
ncbi:hypothetical protein QJS10_CPB15g01308 [Acorus calamus]|uniref:U1-type domain-containing protein n=1 Tax=Acorus calamus TaxID=4465 RepID=A0AAV9D6K7_ACOCL|nr:hypothetical protein QJS10_CPB15g01308 [Acorus calamus]